MTRTLATIVLLAWLLSSPVTAQFSDSDIDFGSITCGEFIQDVSEGDEEDITAVLLWLDGYLSGVTGDTVLSFSGLETFAENLVVHCAQSNRELLIDAARRVGIE